MTLVSVGANCGSLDDARKVFDRMGVKGAQLWNATIAVYMAVGEVGEIAEVAGVL